MTNVDEAVDLDINYLCSVSRNHAVKISKGPLEQV